MEKIPNEQTAATSIPRPSAVFDEERGVAEAAQRSTWRYAFLQAQWQLAYTATNG